MTRIISNATSTALWQSLVRDAARSARIVLDEELESYLVFTLMRHLRDAGMISRLLALDFLDALLLGGRQRQRALGETGDRCLLIAGLFPGQMQRRHVSTSYFLQLGIAAYRCRAEQARDALAELYDHLASAFTVLVRALSELDRTLCNASEPTDLARLLKGYSRNPPAPGNQITLLQAPSRLQ